jgi:hypothetical protein
VINILACLSDSPQSIGRSFCACKALFRHTEAVWRAAVRRRWPDWAAGGPSVGDEYDGVAANWWRRQFELLELREAEPTALADPRDVRATEVVVNERHRSILVEWLCEVSTRQGGCRRRAGGARLVATPAAPRFLMPSMRLLHSHTYQQVAYDWHLESARRTPRWPTPRAPRTLSGGKEWRTLSRSRAQRFFVLNTEATRTCGPKGV